MEGVFTGLAAIRGPLESAHGDDYYQQSEPSASLGDGTLLVVLGDHGEAFGERGERPFDTASSDIDRGENE